MAAVIVPFPSTCRRRQIRKTAAYMTVATPAVAESHCREQLRKLRQRLERLGVAPDLVEQEVSSYEAALRAEVWRQVLTPGGAA